MLQKVPMGPLPGQAPVLTPAAGQVVKPRQEKLRCPPAVQDPAGQPALGVLGDALGREGPLRRLQESGAHLGRHKSLL